LDAASRESKKAVEEARSTNQPTLLCVALAWAAGFVSLSLGELEQADDFGEELVATAYKSSLRPFYAAGLCIRGTLAARRGAPDVAFDLLRPGLAEMQEVRYLLFYPFFRAELALASGAMGRFDESLKEIDDTLRFALETNYRWYVPEILRMKGELLALRGSDDPVLIEDLYRQAMKQGREHQAYFWELTAAANLAGHLHRRRQSADALSVLSSAYNRLSEGFAFSRVSEVKQLLDKLV
jgi:non-specific serine/threonine protein kinase